MTTYWYKSHCKVPDGPELATPPAVSTTQKTSIPSFLTSTFPKDFSKVSNTKESSTTPFSFSAAKCGETASFHAYKVSQTNSETT